MPAQYRFALFVIVVGLFVALGIAGLLVIVGKLPGADERFKKWAIPGFFAGLTSATFALFRAAWIVSATPFVITLVMPPDAPALKGGSYEYDLQDEGKVVRHTGRVQVAFVPPGGWQAKLPGEVADSPVTLHFEDDNGGWWRVGPFFSNYITQSVRKGEKFVATAESRKLPGVAVLAAAEPGREAAAQQQATIRLNNYARSIATQYGRPTWEWRLFVDEPQSVLNTIEKVDYVLHPTFAQPFQSSSDRGRQFELTGSGWGSFDVIVTVQYTNGRATKATYFLDLNKTWPQAAMRVSLEKIHVNWDGSAGPSGWVFEVLADGKPLVSLPNTNYDDGGRNGRGKDYLAAASRWPVGMFRTIKGRTVRLDVKGKRSSGNDVATGVAMLTANGGPVTVTVANPKDPKKGSFVFYFTAKS